MMRKTMRWRRAAGALAAALASVALATSPVWAAASVTGVAFDDTTSGLTIGACAAANNTGQPIPMTITALHPDGSVIDRQTGSLPPFGNAGIVLPQDAGPFLCRFATPAKKNQYFGNATYWTLESGFQVIPDNRGK